MLFKSPSAFVGCPPANYPNPDSTTPKAFYAKSRKPSLALFYRSLTSLKRLSNLTTTARGDGVLNLCICVPPRQGWRKLVYVPACTFLLMSVTAWRYPLLRLSLFLADDEGDSSPFQPLPCRGRSKESECSYVSRKQKSRPQAPNEAKHYQ
jgi:hypothetical protein